MRVLFSGGTFCDLQTLKRLALVADEVGFMDQPSVVFGKWGTVGRESEIRKIDTAGSLVNFSAHVPPSGPVSELYRRYIEADLSNPRFMSIFLNGLASDKRFAEKFIQEEGDYGGKNGKEIRSAIVADGGLLSDPLNLEVERDRMFLVETREDRRNTLKVLAITASIGATSALTVSEATGLLPVADDPYFCQLLGLRTSDRPYVNETPRTAPALALAVAQAVIPDSVLAELSITDVLQFRAETEDAYKAWTVEIDRLAAAIADADPAQAQNEIPRIIATDIKPRLVEYENAMKSARDRLFSEALKKVLTWEVPTLSLAHLTGMNVGSALVLFASALSPAFPAVIDYYKERRELTRNNSMAYLIGVKPGS